jgi:ATP-binding protein involved in chromosome partitioning
MLTKIFTAEGNMNQEEKTKLLNAEADRITDTISKIKYRIAVFSGKGGVGKTTISVNLAYGLCVNGFSTGLLDADITGPNVAKMLGCEEGVIYINESIVPFEKYGAKMISMASLIPKGQPLIWRGPMRSKVINQFLADVDWGELDYLIADLPPGTGDEILTIAQEMKPDCAVIVTTPQEVSVMDAERAVNMAKQMGIPFIGIVENMSGFSCPHCVAEIDLLGKDGGLKLADELGVRFLGKIPFEIEARKQSDIGKPAILKNPNSLFSKSIIEIVNKIKINQQV